MNTKVVEFNHQNIELIRKNNQLYLTGDQIGRVLEYTDTAKVSHLYNAHKSEFDDEMSFLIKHGRTRVRIFNREGAWLIGMFARTPKAAEFRKWVLKVLGAVADGANNAQTDKPVIVSEHTRSLPSGKKEIVLSAKAREEIGGLVKKCCGVAVRDELAKVKVIEYVNPIKNILSDDLLTESSLTPMEIENHLGHLLTGLWDYKKSSADMFKLYRLLEACKGLACRYYSYASHLQGHVDFCEHYRGKNKNTKYFEMNTDALYATIRGMLDTKIELSALK